MLSTLKIFNFLVLNIIPKQIKKIYSEYHIFKDLLITMLGIRNDFIRKSLISSDISSRNYFLFHRLKLLVALHRFDNDDKLKKSVTGFLSRLRQNSE